MALQFVINKPASECNGNAIYIGPTAVDLSPIAEAEFAAALAARKRKDEQAYAKRAYGSMRSYWQKPRAQQFY